MVGLDHSPEHGGQGLSLLEQVIVHEAFGRNTNGVWWYIPTVANVLSHGTPDQIDRYLRPALRGERARVLRDHRGRGRLGSRAACAARRAARATAG